MLDQILKDLEALVPGNGLNLFIKVITPVMSFVNTMETDLKANQTLKNALIDAAVKVLLAQKS
jgi:hypothetical protein